MSQRKNKGEWSECLSFLTCIKLRYLPLVNKNLTPTGNRLKINKVSTLNTTSDCHLNANDTIDIIHKTTGNISRLNVDTILPNNRLTTLTTSIKAGSGSFNIPLFDDIEDQLGFKIGKGTSNQKADLILDIENSNFDLKNEGFGIKSFLGSPPTLLNASMHNTNVAFKVTGLSQSDIATVNNISSRTKIIDRISKIRSLGGILSYSHFQREIMAYNLHMVDSFMPEIMAEMVLEYYENRTSSISTNVDNIIHKLGFSNEPQQIIVKVKRLLVSIMLGIFTNKIWDGTFSANGNIVVKNDGQQVAFHVADMGALNDYLYENIRFDSPSTSRHKYAELFESKGELYFNLNIQLRF